MSFETNKLSNNMATGRQRDRERERMKPKAPIQWLQNNKIKRPHRSTNKKLKDKTKN